jgi:hypothetical protein
MIVDGLYCLPQALAPRTSENAGSYWQTPTAKETGRKPDNYRHYLNQQVHRPDLFPTPTVSQGTTNNGCPQDGRKEYRTKGRPTLGHMAKHNLWPTPAARDYKDTGKSQSELNRNTPPLATHAGGLLSPQWVEWLMGVPIGWTELRPWGMAWFRNKQRKRSKD